MQVHPHFSLILLRVVQGQSAHMAVSDRHASASSFFAHFISDNAGSECAYGSLRSTCRCILIFPLFYCESCKVRVRIWQSQIAMQVHPHFSRILFQIMQGQSVHMAVLDRHAGASSFFPYFIASRARSECAYGSLRSPCRCILIFPLFCCESCKVRVCIWQSQIAMQMHAHFSLIL